MTNFPTLETERLVLRPYEPSDFADCAALWGDPATVAFIGPGRPLSEEEVWSRLLRYIGHWHVLGFGYWVVREKHTSGFVGDVGFQNLKRSSKPSIGTAPEIGWVLARSAQGRGYAREAVAGALAWADAWLPAPETICIIRPAHARSIRIAADVGYRRKGDVIYGGGPIDVYSRPRTLSGSDESRPAIGITGGPHPKRRTEPEPRPRCPSSAFPSRGPWTPPRRR